MKTHNINVASKSSVWRLVIVLAIISVSTQVMAQSKNEVSFYLQGSFAELSYEALGDNSELENGS